MGVPLPFVQGTPEWLEARRSLITATDLPVILGLSPFKCEADLADEKLGLAQPEPPSVAMRRGLALEPLMRDLYQEATGRLVWADPDMRRHDAIEWAACSLDAVSVGMENGQPTRQDDLRVVEFKTTNSRTRFASGLPDDVAAQVQWQLGVTGWSRADVLVMAGDDLLPVFEVEADPQTFDGMLAVAADFRRRLAEGGPFSRSDERIRRESPQDSGVMLPATPDLVEMARLLREAREAKAAADAAEKSVASAIRAILLDASGVEGLLTLRKSADSHKVNWSAVALAYREMLRAVRAEAELDAVVDIHTDTITGPRVLRLLRGGDDD